MTVIYPPQFQRHTTSASRAQSLVREIAATRFDGEFNIGDRVRHALYQWDGAIMPDPDCIAGPGEVLVCVPLNGMAGTVAAIPVRDLVRLYSKGETA